jgi:hypothetical protein
VKGQAGLATALITRGAIRATRTAAAAGPATIRGARLAHGAVMAIAVAATGRIVRPDGLRMATGRIARPGGPRMVALSGRIALPGGLRMATGRTGRPGGPQMVALSGRIALPGAVRTAAGRPGGLRMAAGLPGGRRMVALSGRTGRPGGPMISVAATALTGRIDLRVLRGASIVSGPGAGPARLAAIRALVTAHEDTLTPGLSA